MSLYHAVKKRQGLKKGQATNAVCLAILGRLDKPLKTEYSLEAELLEREAQEKPRAVA